MVSPLFSYFCNALSCLILYTRKLLWYISNVAIIVFYDFITKSLLLPEIESRQIYSLSSKICLNILILSKISIIRTVQCNVTVCFHSTGWFLPLPLSRSIWISLSLLWNFITVLFPMSEPMYRLPRKYNLYLEWFYNFSPCARAVLQWSGVCLKNTVGRAVRMHANLKINKCILRNVLTAVYERKHWSESCGTGFCHI